jgi:hypothetical protein
MLIQEKTSLHVAGNRAIRAALELIQQRGYVIIPPKPGHLINDVSLPLRPRIYRRDGGPPALVGTKTSAPCPALAMTPRCLMEPPDCRTLKSAFASSSVRPSFAVDLFLAA